MPYSDRMRQMATPPLQADPRFLQGIGTGLDTLLARFKDAIKARFPTYAAANNDEYALANIGSDSSLPRYPSETNAQYGARLQRKWEVYERAGAAASPTDPDAYPNPIIQQLEGLGFSDIVLMEYTDWPADAGDPNVHHSPGDWYDSTGTTPWWSRFWIYIGKYNGANIPEGGVLGVGLLGTMYLGFELPAAVINSAVAATIQWKPAHALCPYIAFLTEGTPMDSVLGYGVLGSFTLGSSGMLPGESVVVVNR